MNKTSFFLGVAVVGLSLLLNYCSYKQGKQTELIKQQNKALLEEINKLHKTKELNENAKTLDKLLDAFDDNEVCKFVIDFDLNECLHDKQH